ncbi:TREM2 protein, partial [Nyctibius grandis]|nr:TREM2 protein [Nyctibius grandis]
LHAQTTSVMESRSEGSTLSIQCSYAALAVYQQQKAWCRVTDDGQCEPLVETTYPNQNQYTNRATKGYVTIEDDSTRQTVSITMTNLQAEDSDTYVCAYRSYTGGYLPLKTISLQVFKGCWRVLVCALHLPSNHPDNGGQALCVQDSNINTSIILSVVLSILFILALISLITLCVRQRKQLKRKGTREAENIYEKPEDIAQLDTTERTESTTDDSKDLKYVTLNFKSRLSSEDPLYCNVEPSQTPRKPKDEDVEYAIIALKQLP